MKNKIITRAFYRGFLDKYAGLIDSSLIGSIGGGFLGHAASREGQKSEGAAIGAMGGLAAGLGADMAKSISSMIGLGDGILPQAIGAIAGLTVMKTLYDKAYSADGMKSPFEQNNMINAIDSQLQTASNIVGKGFEYVPFNKEITSGFNQYLEPTILGLINNAKNLNKG